MAHAEDDRLTDAGPDWEALARYLAGESDGAERRRIDAELSAHPDRAALLRALDGALVRPAVVEPAPSEIDATLERVLARRGERPTDGTPILALRSAHRRWRAALMRAAAAVLVVAGGAALWQRASSARAHHAGSAAGAGARVATATGQVDTLQLPDGSRVILGPRSALTILPVFGRTGRTVALQGDAYFEVVHDAARPFVVRTGAVEVRDVGTTFSVQGTSGGVQVAVAAGAVAVRPDSAAPPGATLRAGDRGTVAGDGMLRVERGVVGSVAPAWTAGRLELHDVALAAAAEELRRWFGLELRVDDATLARRHVTASFEASARPDVGSVIAAILGAQARQRGDTLWIEPAPAAPAAR
jgi:transmembrane sensor